MNELLFLQPVFQERIWGGRALETSFGYDIPAGNIGECWGISAHPNGESIIKNGKYASQKLSDLWADDNDIFGGAIGNEKFPLLVKVLDANNDLSVQVHPDDKYAGINENGELGKTECWYIVDAAPDAKIIFGHNAQTKEEMAAMIAAGDWQGFLREQPVRKGDFFYVPSGTIHALCTGTVVLEVQQSSDTTYRLYDYGRLDDAGNERELHVEKSIDVSTVPHVETNPTPVELIAKPELNVVELVANEFFAVYNTTVAGLSEFALPKSTYALISVIEGTGIINDAPVKKGDHIFAPADTLKLDFAGNMQMIIAQP